jgi:glycosyltransferase involved in cell wall biosynthesis
MLENNNKPSISVIIEGYNDSLQLGTVEDVIRSLQDRDFPARNVELILVGSEAQAAGWREIYDRDANFFSVKCVGNDTAHYYQLKNEGAKLATAEILAFIDSDVIPESNWLSSIYFGIVEQGADAVAGISLFRDEHHWLHTYRPFLQTAASISWGFVVPKNWDAPILRPNAFLSHNFGIRTSVFHQHTYREDLGRTCAGSFLFNSLLQLDAKLILQPQQRIAHNFTFWWWLSRLHLRFGYEVYQLRRIDPRYPNKFISKLAILEPLISFFWHVMLDVPRWFRFSGTIGLSKLRQILLLPLLLLLSCFARSAETIGMYLTIFRPEAMAMLAKKS